MYIAITNVILVFYLLNTLYIRAQVLRINPTFESVIKVSKRSIKKNKMALQKDLYRVYKYMHLQSQSGASMIAIYKSLYKVATSKGMKNTLIKLSVASTQSHDLEYAIESIKNDFNFEDGDVFISMLENNLETGIAHESLQRMDHLVFQKYLSYLKKETEQVKDYFVKGLISFAVVTTCMLLFPLIHQMIESSKMIFV